MSFSGFSKIGSQTGRVAWGREITVYNRGGLVRAQADADLMVTLSGNATFEWEGSAEIADGAAHEVQIARRFDEEITAWGALRAGSSRA